MAAPIAQALTLSGSEDTDTLVTLVATDADFDPLTYEIVTPPGSGALTADLRGGPGDFIYQPVKDLNGLVTFTYRAFDGLDYSDAVTVELTVNAVADAPVLNLGYAASYWQTLVSPGEGFTEPAMAKIGDSFLVVWHGNGAGDPEGILLNVYDAEGNYNVGTTLLVNSTTADAQFDPSMAPFGSDIVITWTSANQDGSGTGVYMQRFDAFGNPNGGEMLVNSDHTSGDQGESAVAAAGAGYVVVWSSNDAGETHIFRQQYDTFGGTVGGTEQVDTIPGADGYAPSIAGLDGGGYVVAWNSPDGDGYDVLAQAYDGSNDPVGGNIVLSESAMGDQRLVTVAKVSTGFVAAWAEGDYGGPVEYIVLRVFGNDGTPMTGTIHVPAADLGLIADLTLTSLPDGFALSWEEISNNDHGLYLQRFNLQGQATDDPVRINPTAPLGESAPALLFDSTNNILNVAYVSAQTAETSQIAIEQFDVPTTNSNLLEGTSTGMPFQNATITDIDSSELQSLSISLVDGRAGDLFAYDVSAYPGVSVNFDDNILTFMGPLAVADFQEILRSVGLFVRDGGDTGSRTLNVVAHGVDGDSVTRQFTFGITTDNQTVGGDSSANTLIGGNGNDTLAGGAGIDHLYGNAGSDSLLGGSFNDQLYGGGGDDTLNGGFDNDYMAGGAGDDVFIVNSSLDVIFENAEEGHDTVNANASFTLSADVEDLILSGTGNLLGYGSYVNNLIVGNAGDNTLHGDDGDDTLNGGAGNDVLIGGTGNDMMRGSHGNDTYHYEAGDTIAEYFNQGIDTVITFDSLAAGNNIENLTLDGSNAASLWGNVLDNVLTGNSNANLLSGGQGNDTLAGLAGNDTLNGGQGDDSMYGNTGNDTYYIDSAGDRISEQSGEGTDTALVRTYGYVLDDNVENLTLLEGEGTGMVSANGLANVIKGNSTSNTIYAQGGNDTVTGGAGDDDLHGMDGSDSLFGGSGFDFLYGGAGYDHLNGGADDDNLLGGNGHDTLLGSDGDDLLLGQYGNDVLTGGAGLDIFRFDTVAHSTNNSDTITDFTVGDDYINLVSFAFPALENGALAAYRFTTGTEATSESHRIIYNNTNGSLYYDPDGIGGVSAIKFATLTNLAAITENQLSVFNPLA